MSAAKRFSALTCETNPSSFSQITMAASLREVLKRSGWASKWGGPWYQLKSVKFPEPVIAFTRNYALYASMSNRVIVHLEALAPRVEQYSIDEMFLDVRGIDSCIDFRVSAGSCVNTSGAGMA